MPAAGWAQLAITEQCLDRQQQTFDVVAVWDSKALGARVQTTVHVDSHVSQCRYRAEFWNGSEWVQIASILPADEAVAAFAKLPYSSDVKAKGDAARAVADYLLVRASLVLQ